VGLSLARTLERQLNPGFEMYSNEVEGKVRSWASECLLLLRELLPLMAPVGTFGSWTKEERQTLGYLLPACARSTESAVLLVAYGQLWDAELLVRSVAEGTFKYCYLLQTRESFQQRHREYSHDLWRISLSKDHRKAAAFLSSISNPDDPEWEPIRGRLLNPAELSQIDRDYSQAARRSLESKWGYTGLIGELARSGDAMFSGFGGFSHGYSIASHIQHADYVGVSIPVERDQRSEERRNPLHVAHATRLLSDCLTFLHLRLLVSYRFVGSDLKPVIEAWKNVDIFRATLKEAYQQWMDVEYPRSVDSK
jgi:hypothetical protein